MSQRIVPGSAFPPPEDRGRLKRYRNADHLFHGHHAKHFDAKRIAEKLARANLLQGGTRTQLEGVVYIVHNLPRLIATKFADLVLLQQPDILMPDKTAQEEFTERLRTDAPELWGRLHSAFASKRARGDALLTISREPEGAPQRAGAIDIRAVDVMRWFPVMSVNDPLRVEVHQLAWVEPMADQFFLRVDACEVGRINRFAYKLKPADSSKRTDKDHQLGPWEVGESIPLASHWSGLAEQEIAAVDDFTVVHLPNGMRCETEIYGRGDYEDSGSLFDAVNWALSKWSDANDKVAQLPQVVPYTYLQQDTNYGTSYVPSKYADSFVAQRESATTEEVPHRMTVELSHQTLKDEFDSMLAQTLLRHEMSPALLGLQGGNPVESGTAKSLGMGTTEAACKRDLLQVQPQVDRALNVAARLLGMDEPVSTFWRVGLPKGEAEIREEIASDLRMGLETKRGALQRLHPQMAEEQIDEKMAELQAEEQARADALMQNSVFAAQRR